MKMRTLTAGLLMIGCAALWAAPPAGAIPLNPGVEISAMSCPVAGDCSAAGGYQDGLGHGQGLLLAERHGVWSSAVEAPLPADAGIDPLNPGNNTGVSDIDCAAAGDCTAVGVYTDQTKNDRGLLLTETHGHWTRGVAARLPGDALPPTKARKSTGDNVVLLADACVSAGNCYAVGNYLTDANTLQALIVTERNGRWQVGVAAPLPSGATVRGQRAVLYNITCLHSGSCVAVGAYVDGNGAQQGMLVTESGGVWQAATRAGLPAGAGTNPETTPIAVTCVAQGDCAAAGSYQDGRANSLGVLLSEAGGSWVPGAPATLPTNAAPPTSYNAQTTEIVSISCIDSQGCAAVGSYTDDDGNTQGLLLNETSGVWATGQELALPSNAIHGATKQTAGLDTVACPALGDCVAGGLYTDTAQNDDSLLVTESGGSWAPGVEVALPRGAGQAQYSAVDSISCASVGSCIAIGTYNNHHGDTLGYSVSEQNGVWGRAVALPSPAADAAEVRLSVEELLRPRGKLATVAAIRKARGFKLPYVLLDPGSLKVVWYERHEGKRVLIASGRVHQKLAGSGGLKLRLTHAGRVLFAHGGKLRLTAAAVMRLRGRRATAGSGPFTLS